LRKFSLRLEPAASEVKGKCANHLATEAPKLKKLSCNLSLLNSYQHSFYVIISSQLSSTFIQLLFSFDRGIYTMLYTNDVFLNLLDTQGWGVSPRGAGYLFGSDVVSQVSIFVNIIF
jgi:hypothetical protein